ncbi:7503_t:CDS:2, partial [Diversispora eburnea]
MEPLLIAIKHLDTNRTSMYYENWVNLLLPRNAREPESQRARGPKSQMTGKPENRRATNI